jgi:ribosomal protein L31
MSNPLDDRKKALEEDYFRRKDQEAIEKMRARMDAEQQAQQAEAARLKCPKCDGTLQETRFENVSIDTCDKCHGVWLDAGEIETLTKREGGGWLSRLWGSERKDEG